MTPLTKDLLDKLLDLLPMIAVSKGRKTVFFHYPEIEYDHGYDYITECGYYPLIKKLIDRVVEIINSDIKSLDRDFEKDVFPQLIKELRREKLKKILNK